MKCLFFISLILFNYSVSIKGLKTEIPSEYKIAPWYDFKPSAITYSFDDGLSKHYSVVVPLFDKYGLKATFNLITDRCKEWENYKIAASNGHEIASHTVGHMNLKNPDIYPTGFTINIKESKETIESKIGKECVTLAYPYGGIPYDLEMTKKYYISGRTTSAKIISPNPEDMFDLAGCGIGAGSLSKAADLNKFADRVRDEGGWVVFMIHGVDNETEYAPLYSQELDPHLNYVKESGNFWIDTFVKISKYLYESNSLIITENEVKDEIEINVDCGFKTEVTKMDVPVTVSREIKEEEKIKKAKIINLKNKKTIKFRIDENKIIFDVIPGESYRLTFGEGNKNNTAKIILIVFGVLVLTIAIAACVYFIKKKQTNSSLIEKIQELIK